MSPAGIKPRLTRLHHHPRCCMPRGLLLIPLQFIVNFLEKNAPFCHSLWGAQTSVGRFMRKIPVCLFHWLRFHFSGRCVICIASSDTLFVYIRIEIVHSLWHLCVCRVILFITYVYIYIYNISISDAFNAQFCLTYKSFYFCFRVQIQSSGL